MDCSAPSTPSKQERKPSQDCRLVTQQCDRELTPNYGGTRTVGLSAIRFEPPPVIFAAAAAVDGLTAQQPSSPRRLAIYGLFRVGLRYGLSPMRSGTNHPVVAVAARLCHCTAPRPFCVRFGAARSSRRSRGVADGYDSCDKQGIQYLLWKTSSIFWEEVKCTVISWEKSRSIFCESAARGIRSDGLRGSGGPGLALFSHAKNLGSRILRVRSCSQETRV